MDTLFKTAAGITTMWSLAAFAIAAILYFTRGRKTPHLAWVGMGSIVVLAAIPTVSWVLLERDKAYSEAVKSERQFEAASIYRVRVTVLDADKMPVEDARVWSSVGGEAKRVVGGWQFDVPAATKPVDGRMVVYAAVENAFLRGSRDVQLGGDLNPTAAIQLEKDSSAAVRGLVADAAGKAVEGARVTVVGYADAVVTKSDGNFELPAHAARGQQVQLHAEKQGHGSVTQWHPAGDSPATLVLQASEGK